MAVRPLHRCLLVVAITCFATAGCGTRYLNGCGPSGRIVHAAVRPPGSGAVVVDFGDRQGVAGDSLEIHWPGGELPVEAIPEVGWVFDRWEGGVTTPTSRRTKLNGRRNGHVICVFRAETSEK